MPLYIVAYFLTCLTEAQELRGVCCVELSVFVTEKLLAFGSWPLAGLAKS